jgi:hypothetical protein
MERRRRAALVLVLALALAGLAAGARALRTSPPKPEELADYWGFEPRCAYGF